MSWLRIAADLLRGAMTSELPPRHVADQPPPENMTDLLDLINRHRSDVRLGFESLSQNIREQREAHEQALRAQRRWNYGLLAAVLVLAVLVVVLYLRG